MTTTTHDRSVVTTAGLLRAGTAAATLYVMLAAGQYLFLDGLDPRKHVLSLAENGDFGWVQTGNFLLTGILTVVAAAGLRQAIRTGIGSKAVPVLVALYGMGLIGAGVFRSDPAAGFPPGTSTGSTTISGHGLAHFVAAGIGFVALIAAGLTMARRYRVQRFAGQAWYSAVTALALMIAWIGISSGVPSTLTTVGFIIAALNASIWVAVTCRVFGTAPR